MASTQIVKNQANTSADTPQVFYTAPAGGTGTVIESFTAYNTSAINASYKAFISDGITADQPIIPFKVVVWGENDLGIGLVNQVIPPGGSLKIESSAIDSIYVTVAGSENGS